MIKSSNHVTLLHIDTTNLNTIHEFTWFQALKVTDRRWIFNLIHLCHPIFKEYIYNDYYFVNCRRATSRWLIDEWTFAGFDFYSVFCFPSTLPALEHCNWRIVAYERQKIARELFTIGFEGRLRWLCNKKVNKSPLHSDGVTENVSLIPLKKYCRTKFQKQDWKWSTHTRLATA